MLDAVLEPPVRTKTGERLSGFVPAPARQRPVNWLGVVQMLFLLLLPCACYLPALKGEFLWDDDVLVSDNPMLRSLDGLGRIWFSTQPLDYFPLTNTSFWLEWRLWGNDPLGYHVVNLALHLSAAFLLWRLLKVLRLPGAWLGALVFAIHPINVASVAWVSERKNVLSMVFYLGSLICYVRSEDEWTGSATRKWYGWALAWFVLAVLSKSSVVMLPCVLLLLAWWRRGRIDRRDVTRSVPFFVASLAAGLVTIWFQYHRALAGENLEHANPLWVRAAFAGRAVFFYLGKTFWPHPLSMLYPRWEAPGSLAAAALWPLAVAALLAAAWFGRRWWGRGPLAALGYFVLTLLPVSGLLHMSFFLHSNVSDHLVYLSVPGMIALVAAVLGAGYARGGNAARVSIVSATAAVVMLGLYGYQRAEDFSSAERLWHATLEVYPRSFAAHNNLGLDFQQHGDLLRAEAHFREAMNIDPKLDSAGTNLANVLRMEGRWKPSAELYRRVLDAYPDAQRYNNYAVALIELGETAKAREALENALRLSPRMSGAYYNLYRLDLAEHNLSDAGAQLRACLKIDPDDVQALTALVALNLEQPGLPPLSPPAAEAVLALAERDCEITGYSNAPILGLLSKALAAAGRRGEAVAIARRAQAAATANKQPELAAQIEEDLHALQP